MDPSAPPSERRTVAWPLFGAGFVTAFGSHGVAANLGTAAGDPGEQLLVLGVLLALYDGAEIVLKPLFGALADRVGLRPVLLGGLVAFAVASTAFALVETPAALAAARFAQGGAASAFSPSASALIARLAPSHRRGAVFGRYGAFKSLGYTSGPLLGGALVALGGFTALFGALAVLALVVTVWAALAVPAPAPLPRRRQSALDLARRLTDRDFAAPTTALAVTAAALSCGVGFLPVLGARAGLGPVITGAAVSVLAVAAAVSQPLVGRLRDRGRCHDRTALVVGTLVTAGGLALPAVLPSQAGLLGAALATGVGTGILTPVAYARLATAGPPERLGQTMGTAEIGREVVEAGGPLLTGALAAAAGLDVGFLGIAALVALTVTSAAAARSRPTDPGADRSPPTGS